MAHIEKSVFISYRRRDVSWALTVYQFLSNHGYDVFFDYLSIPSGDFGQVILGNIKARAHFVLILTPSAMDRCSEPDDWLRCEIETAIGEKRNIVPLFFDGFNFSSSNVTAQLTGGMKNLSRYNGITIYPDYFNEGMERLGKFLNVPLDAVLHPVSARVLQVVEENRRAANAAPVGRVSNPTPAIQPEQSQAKSLTYETRAPENITLSNGMELLRVPAGKFLMGSRDDNKLAYS